MPSCEFFPIEAVKTNIIGTENLINSAYKNNVKRVIVLSTDKAVYPVNAMGMSKSLAEKTVIAKSDTTKKYPKLHKICIVIGLEGRYTSIYQTSY